MNTAAEIAVEVDRLVLGTYRNIGKLHHDHLMELATGVGLSRIGELSILDAELAAGSIPYIRSWACGCSTDTLRPATYTSPRWLNWAS